MDNSVWLAIIAAVIGIMSPVLVSILASMSRSREKQEDWARQDLVAQRVEDAARLQTKRQDEVRKQVEDVATQAREAAKLLRISTAAAERNTQDIKIDVKAVHTLVNSDKTERMKRELIALEGQLRALRMLEHLGMKLTPPVEQSVDDRVVVETLTKEIKQLEVSLKDRAENLKVVEEQMAQALTLGTATEAREVDNDRTAAATERVAEATERVALATETKVTSETKGKLT